MTLTKGNRYDVTRLALEAWTMGDGTGHEGYDVWAYFESRGTYLGPDEHGIEPLVTEQARDGRVAESYICVAFSEFGD